MWITARQTHREPSGKVGWQLACGQDAHPSPAFPKLPHTRHTSSRQASVFVQALWIMVSGYLSTETGLYIHHYQNDLLNTFLSVLIIGRGKPCAIADRMRTGTRSVRPGRRERDVNRRGRTERKQERRRGLWMTAIERWLEIDLCRGFL